MKQELGETTYIFVAYNTTTDRKNLLVVKAVPDLRIFSIRKQE